MTWLAPVTIAGVAVLAVLLWLFFRTRRQDLIAEILAKRKATSKLAMRADYVQGIERIPVALALAADTIYYANPEMDASFDVAAIDEVEYDDELATGQTVDAGHRVLRLRAHGRAIEFILTSADAQQWNGMLAPHRTGEPAKHAV